MGWSKRSGGDRNFFKFQTPGDELIGRWRGTRPGKYGDNGVVEEKGGDRQEFTLNAALSDLAEIEQGTPVRIVYTGKQTSKQGNEFKAFDIFTWEEGKETDDEVSEFSGPVEPKGNGSDDEVPF